MGTQLPLCEYHVLHTQRSLPVALVYPSKAQAVHDTASGTELKVLMAQGVQVVLLLRKVPGLHAPLDD
jgi:hypothetical protein